jgi:rubrerythrin
VGERNAPDTRLNAAAQLLLAVLDELTQAQDPPDELTRRRLRVLSSAVSHIASQLVEHLDTIARPRRQNECPHCGWTRATREQCPRCGRLVSTSRGVRRVPERA